jgi:hypothetical protein
MIPMVDEIKLNAPHQMIHGDQIYAKARTGAKLHVTSLASMATRVTAGL